jgi:hypothetical protein
LSLDRHFERKILGKNLSGLVIPGIAELFWMVWFFSEHILPYSESSSFVDKVQFLQPGNILPLVAQPLG